MSIDVDAVNERLNGLVTLLQAVGVDSNAVARVSNKMGSNGESNRGGETRQLNDEQIEAIIRKLQLAQAEAPQIIAALEAHAESRSTAGGNRQHQQQQHQQQYHHEPEPEEDDDDDEDDEDDDDANYPMVGHGVSDDISVVSDLTTPTVVVGVAVPEEEHYRDTLPPMIIGGGSAPPMMLNPSKRKNHVTPVRPGINPPRRNAPAPRLSSGSGGAAAKRRNNYNSTMAKIEPVASTRGPSKSAAAIPQPPTKAAPRIPKEHRSTSNSSATGEQRIKKKKPVSSSRPEVATDDNFTELARSHTGSHANRWESPHNNDGLAMGWNAFDDDVSPVSPTKSRGGSTSTPPTVIDNDGFLVGESFDPFSTGASNPFSSSASPSNNQRLSSSAGDLAFSSGAHNGRPPHQQQQHYSLPSSNSSLNYGERLRRPKTGTSSKPRPVAAAPAPMPAPQPIAPLRPKPIGAASAGRPRRSRRASLAM